jgi:hypothetical protein
LRSLDNPYPPAAARETAVRYEPQGATVRQFSTVSATFWGVLLDQLWVK